MIKSLSVFITFLGYFAFGFFFSGDVDVKINQPSEVAPGEEYTCEITVAKSDLQGFAKVQQYLPEGFTAKAVETKSATFSAVGGVVKYIWMALPSEEEFTISYKVKVDESAVPGDKELTGKFSYLLDNVKESKDFPVTTIRVKGDDVAAVTEENSATSQVEQGADQLASQANESVSEVASTASSAVQGAVVDGEKISIFRTIEPMQEAGKYKVNLHIVNNGLTGFAKLQDILPGETMGYEEQPGSAVYSFTSRKSKFVWMNFPTDKEFDVSYMAVVKDVKDLENIQGEFSYLDQNQTMRVAVKSSSDAPSAPASNEGLASAVNNQAPAVEDASGVDVSTALTEVEQETLNKANQVAEQVEKETQGVIEQAEQEVVASVEPMGSEKEEKTVSDIASNTNKVAKLAAQNKGLGYKVQVMANHRTIKDVSGYFKKTYSYTETPIAVENHEGWIKYTVDWYDNYKAARDRRNQVTSSYNFPGPFVTAYNDGKRITVQEALMITKDKWVP